MSDVANHDALYNSNRRHGHLGGSSPDAFEATQKTYRSVHSTSWELRCRRFNSVPGHFQSLTRAPPAA